VLPLVSKSWARALTGPSPAWHSVDLWVCSHRRLDVKAILQWFARRPGYGSTSKATHRFALML